MDNEEKQLISVLIKLIMFLSCLFFWSSDIFIELELANTKTDSFLIIFGFVLFVMLVYNILAIIIKLFTNE